MLSPSSSISNLSNTSSNKKFKADTDSSADNIASQQENTNKNKLLNGIMKNTELNDVTNNTNENNNCKFNGTEQKLNGTAHKTREDVNKCDKEELMDDSEYIQNGNKSVKAETEDENDCEMIDETELKQEIEPEIKTETVLTNGTVSEETASHESLEEAAPAPCSPSTPLAVLSDEEQIKLELEKLSQLAEIDANNNSELFRSRRTALKHAKAQKLKQLQIDLKNEEAKLILLKRLYYSQRIASQPITQQQQLLKQQQLQQQQKAQQLKKSAAMANQALPGGLTNGLQGQRQSIMNNKPQPNQLAQATRMAAAAALTEPRPVSQSSSSTNLTKPNNLPTSNNMQRNPSATQISSVNSRNNPLNRQANSGTASPVNNGNPKVFPAASVVQSSGSAVSPSSAFSPKVPEKTPVVSQAAVSQLVRKELEKSLAQIEFPKPPAQDIYFLPNTNNSEFLMCLGLEEVAKCVQEHLILKQIKADVKEQQQQQANNESDASKIVKPDTVIEIVYEYPLFCAQCNTDFTPVWRLDKNGLNLCEKCLKQLEKKQIKTEHNARLKQAFLKAVKDKEVFEKQLIAEQQKQLELQRAQRAANPSPVVVNSNVNSSASSSNSHDRAPSSNSSQQQQRSNTQGRPSSNSSANINNNNNPGRGFNSNSAAPQANNINSSGHTNNTNSMSRQQQAMQQRRSLQNNQGASMAQNKPKGGVNYQMPGKSAINNNVVNNSMKTSSSNGNHPNRSIGNNSGNQQHLHNQQNHSSMQQNKHKSDQMQASSRSGQTSSQSNTNPQRQRQSMGNINNNSQQANNQKSFSSRNNSNLDNASDVTAAQLQAQAAQLQLAAAFANTPALAAFAQQQQQQQQAAILQRLMQNAGAGGFNPLHSLGLGSPASAALNYLNMFPNQRKNP